jgi:hypothetical protein
VDRLVLEDGASRPIIPRSALRELGVAATALDDGNDLVEAVPRAAWRGVCEAARRLAIG